MNIAKLLLLLRLGFAVGQATDETQDHRNLRWGGWKSSWGSSSEDSILDLVVETDELSTLEVLLGSAGLADSFGCKTYWCWSKFTVFAPNNAAFDALETADKALYDSLIDDENKDLLRAVLRYHAAYGKFPSSTINDGDEIPTLLMGEDVTASVSGDIKINDSTVIDPDIEAKNGIVHIIDEVLVPPFLSTTITDIVVGNDDFSILKDAVIKAELADTLANSGPFTVFAPPNKAFAKFFDDNNFENGLDDIDKDTLANVLLYHVVDGITVKSELKSGSVTTLSEEDIDVDVKGYFQKRVVLNDDVRITSADIFAKNGVIHVIDEVLTPPAPAPSIVDIVVAEEDFSSLEAAVIKAELVDTLSGDGPFTVFAPTNAAFDKLLKDLGVDFDQLTKEDLEPILLYHVVSGKVESSDLTDGLVTTAGGSDILVNVWKTWFHGKSATLNKDVRVKKFDIEASNGIIHVIDSVLIPPKNLVETATKLGLTELANALVAANLDDDVANAEAWTIFAPTNQAFEDAGDVPAESLANILTYHVVEGKVLKDDLEDGPVTTLQSEDIDVKLYYSWWWKKLMAVILNGDTYVRKADNIASNGVIHIINEVLIPPSLT